MFTSPRCSFSWKQDLRKLESVNQGVSSLEPEKVLVKSCIVLDYVAVIFGSKGSL